jgi:FHA domain/DUF1707 SHOCT-like domain
VVVRASDDTREHTVARLRGGLTAGRLGLDTFVRRVDQAYDAKTRDELSHLTRDLPRPRAWWERLTGLFDDHRPRTAVRPLRPPPLEAGTSVTLGRSPHCDYVVGDMTVSARHAELRRTAGGWSLRDLGSRNGTRVNGWLVKEQRLVDGDEVALGASEFVFREPLSSG